MPYGKCPNLGPGHSSNCRRCNGTGRAWLSDEEARWAIQKPFLAVGLIVLFFLGAVMFGGGESAEPGAPPPLRDRPATGQLSIVKYGGRYAYYEMGEGDGFTLSETPPHENVAVIYESVTLEVGNRGELVDVSRGRKIPRQKVRPMRQPWRQTIELYGSKLNAVEVVYVPPATASDEERRLASLQSN